MWLLCLYFNLVQKEICLIPGKLKIEIIENDYVIEIYETEPRKLTFVMYPDDPRSETYLELVTDTVEFSALLKRLLDNGTAGGHEVLS